MCPQSVQFFLISSAFTFVHTNKVNEATWVESKELSQKYRRLGNTTIGNRRKGNRREAEKVGETEYN